MLNYTDIEAWLKNSIPGLIVLGALGSVLAVWIFRAMGFLVRLTQRGKQAYASREYRRGMVTGIISSHFLTEHDPLSALIWYSYKTLRFLCGMTVLILAFVVAAALLIVGQTTVLTAGSLISVIVFFLAARWMYEEFRDVRTAFNYHLHPIIEESLKEYSAQNGKDLSRNADSPLTGRGDR